MTAVLKPLHGLRVLVPRGGTWGEIVSKVLRDRGATPVISPLIDFAGTSEEETLKVALERLADGYFDWITATSATVVDVLEHHGAVIPETTRVAVVGEATALAFTEKGYEVSLTPPDSDNTAAGLLKVWPQKTESVKVLTLRSNVAKPVLTVGLIDSGHEVTQVVAFRTVGVPPSVHIREDVESGHINALLVATPMIAREVQQSFNELPQDTIIACVGQSARDEALAIGLCDGRVLEDPLVRSIIDTVESAIEYSDMVD